MGTCRDEIGNFRCFCPPEYTGRYCEAKVSGANVNRCGSSQCVNGKCLSGPGSHTCKCLAGFSGSSCEQDINECENSPCKNSGKCINTFGNYTCDCLMGYAGKICFVLFFYQ